MYTQKDLMPNFHIEKMPDVKIKNISIKNYKIFHDYKINFEHDGKITNFACFIGSNGSGKSTTLEIVQSLFSNYDQYEDNRLRNLLLKGVRHVEGEKDYSGDFCIKADISCSEGDYSVQLTKDGFSQDHPQLIKELMLRLCYYTRFDQELKIFRLPKDRWEIFKELFEAVTGFTVEQEKKEGTISFSICEEVEKYDVSGFYVKKPNETIYYKECSDGERKIMKSFSSLLNLQYAPSIILIDNVEMHVESGRHLPLIQAMKKCFPNSQIITTTHSYHISRNFSNKKQVYDLRLLNAKEIYKKEPWRLQIQDEIKDSIIKVDSMGGYPVLKQNGKALLEKLDSEISNVYEFIVELKLFINTVNNHFLYDLILK